MQVTPTSPADPGTAALLADYFAERSAGFAVVGAYRTSPLDPAAFTPPDGVFLRIDDDDGTPFGCGGIRQLPQLPGRTFEVKHLFVAPPGRGRGLGRMMLGELEQRARAFGGTALVLDTNQSLLAAAALYRSSGFAPVPPYNDNPNATDWYAKPLTGA